MRNVDKLTLNTGERTTVGVFNVDRLGFGPPDELAIGGLHKSSRELRLPAHHSLLYLELGIGTAVVDGLAYEGVDLSVDSVLRSLDNTLFAGRLPSQTAPSPPPPDSP